MTSDKPIQLDFVDNVKSQTMTWSTTEGITLHNIETVIPFVLTNIDLWVWLFFDTDELVKKYHQDGTEDKVKSEYLRSLKSFQYPEDYLRQVTFYIDSHENVVKNF